MKRVIKDPTYNVYSSGGNVETSKNRLSKDDLKKLASEKDLIKELLRKSGVLVGK
jgi:hypothetical protein